jgi:hypothetical protein
MNKSQWIACIRRVKDISVILTCVAICASLVVAFADLRSSWRRDRFAGIEQARQVFQNEASIRDESTLFLRDFGSSSTPDSLLRQYKSGRAIYYADDPLLRRYRMIAHHYEEVGALIKAEYIDFDLYYDLVPFPDDFWTQTAALRDVIGKNWAGPKQALPDFLSNFEYLCELYNKRRAI